MIKQRTRYVVEAVLAFVAACLALLELVLSASRGVPAGSTRFICLQLSAVISLVMFLIASARHIQSSKD